MYEAWASHAALLVTSRSSAQTNYPVRVDVPFAPGMSANLDDMRFSTADESTALTFWRASYTSSSAAVFYVVLPSLPASGGSVTIRKHWGNVAAAYGGAPYGANGLFGSLDGGSGSPALSHPATGQVGPGTSGTWKDRYVFDPRFVVRPDGITAYQDGSGYSYIQHLGASAAHDTYGSGGGSGGPGDDRPGLIRAASGFGSFTDLTPTAPLVSWGTGTWEPTSAAHYDSRVLQAWRIVAENDTSFTMWTDGDRGPTNVKEDYTQGVNYSPSIPNAGGWTKANGGNLTFQSGHANAGSLDDAIAYGGDIVYRPDHPDPNKRFWNYYTGLSITKGKWGVMLAYGPTREGPWTRHSATWIFQPMTSGGYYDGGISKVFRLRGITYLIWEKYGYGGTWESRVAISADDGVTFTDRGQIFTTGGAGAWDRGRMYWLDFAYDPSTANTWRTAYSGAATGGSYAGDTTFVPADLRIGFGSFTAPPPFLSTEPEVTTPSALTLTGGAGGWAQAGGALTVAVASVGVRSVATADVSGPGGLLRFAGGDSARFSLSLNGSTWSASLAVPPGVSQVFISVVPQAGDSHLATSLGVPT